MNDKDSQTVRSHNVVIVIITVACLGAVIETITQGWEMWVVPLILIGIVSCWWFHVTHYKEPSTRENYYLIFSLLVAFFHSVHATSYFDVIVISAILMSVIALLRRREFMPIAFGEFFFIIIAQTIYARYTMTMVFDSLTISRIILHVIGEICLYRTLLELMNNYRVAERDLDAIKKGDEADREGMEDFLVNISHELRTPVNVINGMSSLILKKEMREDVLSIRDAGMRLSHQIEDIQDYSEIQRADVVLENDRYMITSLLNDIAVQFNVMSQKKDLEFVIDLDPNVPAVLKGDGKKINKIMLHLIDNGFKFTRTGGVYLKVSSMKRDYGVNLTIEVTDTGIGMTEADKNKISRGSYQSNRKRNRSTGGIGLGLSIVYGFTRLMGGFVSIDSTRKKGTTVRVSVVQEIIDPSPCLQVFPKQFLGVVFHVFPEKYSVPQVREFYKNMASNMAQGLRTNLYSAPNLKELQKLIATGNITHVFMGEEEYNSDPDYYDELSRGKVVVTVSANMDFKDTGKGNIIVMPKPLYGYPVSKILNGETVLEELLTGDEKKILNLDGVRTLIVDDEPMNLVVATGLFKEYNMIIETAESGREALQKYDAADYDVVFMDHMMPEMDGVEAMRQLRFMADEKGRKLRIVALTANAISGAKDMFLREGFDGFIAKPININDFERVMIRVMSDGSTEYNGGAG